MEGKLTPKRRAFIEEYCKDFNGQKAAERAGYSPRTARVTASKLLKNVTIANKIKEKLGLVAMEADEALERIAQLGRQGKSENTRLRALESILKVHGLTKEKAEVQGDLNITVKLDDQR